MHNFTSLSTRSKTILGIISLAAIFGGVTLWYARQSESHAGIPPSENTNFGETGYIEDRKPEKFNDGLYLLYEKPGAPALSVQLAFDERSICTFDGQSIACVALNVTIDTATRGKRAFVTGIRTGDTLLVRSLEIVPAPAE